jgi:hypothetical protein
MQTFAHPTAAQAEFLAAEPDMFGDNQPAHKPPAGPRIGFTGTLLRAAEVRCKPMGDQLHTVPVLCLELRSHSPGGQTMHAEQAFTDATRHQAEALAKRLPKGAQVRIVTQLADMRITLPGIDSVELSS